jgi:hypothetical protein
MYERVKNRGLKGISYVLANSENYKIRNRSYARELA